MIPSQVAGRRDPPTEVRAWLVHMFWDHSHNIAGIVGRRFPPQPPKLATSFPNDGVVGGEGRG